jgi:hypothetical protein
LPEDTPQQTLRKQIEDAAVKVMRQISSDMRRYTFRESALEEVSRRVEQYGTSSTLAGTLRLLKQGRERLIARAEREKIEPGLLAFTVLAEAEIDGQAANLVELTDGVIPDLLWVRDIIGSEEADKSLMIVAAYKMGRGSKLSHPIIVARRQLGKARNYEGTVWYLYEHGGIKKPVYDYVIGFLALAIIAQEPHQFQVDADSLTF